MPLNCGVGEDSWVSLGQQGDQASQSYSKLTLNLIEGTDAEVEAPVLWPPDVKNWLIRKDPDCRQDWRQEVKGTKEDEMAGWHHWLDGHMFEQAPGASDGQGSLAHCSPCALKESDMTEQLNWTRLCTQALQFNLFYVWLIFHIGKTVWSTWCGKFIHCLVCRSLIILWLNTLWRSQITGRDHVV